jgi:hypothetical protein
MPIDAPAPEEAMRNHALSEQKHAHRQDYEKHNEPQLRAFSEYI